MINIKNKQVKDYFDYLNNTFHNQKIDKQIRINAYKKMDIVEALVSIYEYNATLDSEEIEDLKLNTTPILPEKYKTIYSDRTNNKEDKFSDIYDVGEEFGKLLINSLIRNKKE